MLSSDLVVPADTDAFVLDTSGVVIDLNGFTILGPFSCSTSSCVAGAGSAIRPGISLAFGRDSTVRNGTVRGFAGDCVSLFSQVRVEDLLVTECGLNGISVRDGSLVTNNRVSRTGQHGILMTGIAHPAAFAHNSVGSAGLGGGSFTAVFGGAASGGNSCDDGSCRRVPLRRFYMTSTQVLGDAPLAACAARYHMASLWEILDPTSFQYETSLGERSGGGAATDE